MMVEYEIIKVVSVQSLKDIPPDAKIKSIDMNRVIGMCVKCGHPVFMDDGGYTHKQKCWHTGCCPQEIINVIEHEMFDIEPRHFEEVLGRVKSIHDARFKHKCPEWDGLEIDEFSLEFNACTCFR